jgi:hypothetical protein
VVGVQTEDRGHETGNSEALVRLAT